MKKKKVIILVLMGVLLVTAAIWIFCFPSITFELNGEENIVTNYQDEYDDLGVSLKIFGFDAGSLVKTTGEVNVNEIGVYTVTYKYAFGIKKGELTRKVEVRDLVPPVVTTAVDQVLYANWGDGVRFPYFEATDNVDGDVTASLTSGEFDKTYIGINFVLFQATDSAGNVGSYVQPVGVYDEDEGKPAMPSSLQDNVYHMTVEDDKWNIWGYSAPVGEEYSVSLVNGSNTDNYPLTQLDTSRDGYYYASISVGDLANGTYKLAILQDKTVQYPSINYYNTAQKLGRWHIKDKLVTFNYDDGISITVEDFAYLYDIAIDVGHGNDDPGAVAVDGTAEAKINLMVSEYEKERYESFGLKVWLIRDSQQYTELLGENDWATLQKVGWTTGWYGAVSRYTYSNHHNSDTVGYTRGPEIIVLPDASKEELAVEYTLMNSFTGIYPIINTDWLMFTRNYSTGRRYDRQDGTAYPEYRIYYANMRYPLEDFGVMVTTYEGAYINNAAEYRWYITQEHWKDVSEAKIKAYVEALGLTYTKP